MYLTQLISPEFKIDRYAIVVLFLLSANEVAERQCFTPVCQSFCSQGEVYTPLGRHPRQTPPGRHPDTPLADTPCLADTAPPPETATAADGTHPTGMHSCTPTENITFHTHCECPVCGKFAESVAKINNSKRISFVFRDQHGI